MQRYIKGRWLLPALLALAAAGCTCGAPVEPPASGGYPLDSGGRVVEQLEVGSSLQVAARGLEPGVLYEFRLGLGEPAPSAAQAVSFARLTASAAGQVAPFVLWYQSGVVGCSVPGREKPLPFSFRTFEDAEQALAGKRLVVTIHPVERDPSGQTPPMRLAVGEAVSRFELPVQPRVSALAYPSDAEGCLVNAREAQTADAFVSGRSFASGEEVEVVLVPNQRAWSVGDAVADATGEGPVKVKANERGRFTVKVWSQARQRRGAFDIVVRRRLGERDEKIPARILRPVDLALSGSDTAYLLFLRYPPGGPTMDIAGRPVGGFPYFEFADSFASQGDTVWGAVDPTYVPTTHAGGPTAAYYVVAHRSVAGWDPLLGGSTSLTDLSGGIEIAPVKAGCINCSEMPIWSVSSSPPPSVGDYDVVVDFGLGDGSYDSSVDFLDGADQIGFSVVKDPYDLGPTPIGISTYSQDNFFPTLGGAANVDLRATVRYPATAAGVDTPVAAGAHPIFLIEHGNHAMCRTCRDNSGNPAPCTSFPPNEYCSRTYDHATCPNRVLNHEGYTRLLEILASHGIIAVSIDAYDLTGCVSGFIAERGQLLLKHLELWSHMNNTGTFTSYPDFFAARFAGKVDLSKVSVSGHSRGGEASVSAYMQNPGGSPFTILAVSSIAPVDFLGYTLPRVPYFVILPAGDGDVSNLSGQRIYDRSGNALVPPDDVTKSAIHVYGADHNFFNSVWAADGDDSPSTRADYIPQADQRKLGDAYLAAFTRIHLNGETVYEDMLRGRLTFPSTAGRKIYNIRHEQSHRRLENGSSSSVASGVTATSVTGFTPPHATTAVRMTWSASTAEATYSIPAGPQRDVTPFEVMSLRAAQSDATTNPTTGSQDFLVELRGGGQVRGVFVTRFDDVPRPYDHPTKSDDHNVMTTVRIPLHSYILNRSNVTLNDIDTVKLRFLNPSQGEIYVDDIEFSR